jgi:hypothetical protein
MHHGILVKLNVIIVLIVEVLIFQLLVIQINQEHVGLNIMYLINLEIVIGIYLKKYNTSKLFKATKSFKIFN